MDQHRIRVLGGIQPQVHGQLSKGNYVASCSCGWMGQAQPTRAAAERDGDEHVVAAT